MKYSPCSKDIKAEAEILALTKAFLGIEKSDTSKDNILKVHIGATCQLIRNYINMCPSEPVPEALYYLWAEMASKRYTASIASISKDESGNIVVKGRVNSVTDGSQSVSYGYENAAGSLVSSEADKALLSGYAVQLNPYKQIRWIP